MKNGLLLSVLGIAFLAKLALVLWGVDRGFEIADEGLFLMALNHPEGSPAGFEFYRLLTLLGHPPHFEVIGGRLLRIALELSAVSVLAGGVYGWWRSSVFGPPDIGRVTFLAFCLLGTFLNAGSRGLSYNDVTNLCTFAAFGCLFVLASQPHTDARRRGWAGAMGIAVGFQLLVKFPTAILVSVLLSIYLLVFLPVRIRSWRREALAVFWIALVLTAVVPMAAMYDWAGLVARYQQATVLRTNLKYSIGEVLSHYWYFDIASHTNLLGLVATFTVTYALLRALPARLVASGDRGTDVVLAGSLAIAALVLLVGVRAYHPFNVHSSLLYLFCFVPFLAVVLLLVWALQRHAAVEAAPQRARADLVALGLLSALPFANIAGTNVALTLKLPSHVAPLFVAVAVLVHALRRRGYAMSYLLVCAILVCLTSVIVVHHQLYWPYGVPTPLYDQKLALARPAGLKVDPATAGFLEALAAAAAKAGFRSGDPVVALDYMPGLVNYLDARSPGSLFYTPNSTHYNCDMLNATPWTQLPYLILGRPLGPRQRACLTAWVFPDDFELVATLPNPYRKVYPYFFSLPEFESVYLYAPRLRAQGQTTPGGST